MDPVSVTRVAATVVAVAAPASALATVTWSPTFTSPSAPSDAVVTVVAPVVVTFTGRAGARG